MIECRRLFSKKLLVMIVVCMIALLVLTVSKEFSNRSFVEFSQMIDYEKKLYETGMDDIDITDNKKLSDTMYASIISEYKSHLEYINSYNDEVASIISNAERMNTFSIFNNDETSNEKNLKKTIRDYSRIKDTKLVMSYDKAAKQYIDNNFPVYLSVIIIIYMVHRLYEGEDNCMQYIERCIKRRTGLQITRLTGLFAGTSVVYLILSSESFLINEIMYRGWNTLLNPIQNLEKYSHFVFNMSQLEYIIFDYIYYVIVLYFAACIIWFLYAVFYKRIYSLVCISIIICFEFIIYRCISPLSRYNIFRKYNIIRIGDIRDIICVYSNRKIGLVMISDIYLLAGIIILLTWFLMILGVSILYNKRPAKAGRIRCFDIVILKVQRILSDVPFVLKEIYIFLISCRGALVVIISIFLCIYFTMDSVIDYSDRFKEYDGIYREYGGEDYKYISDKITESKNEYQSVYARQQEKYDEYRNGIISLDDMHGINVELQSAKTQYSYWREFEEKGEYLAHISDTYKIDGYMMSDRGYESVIGTYSYNRERIIFAVILISILIVYSQIIKLNNKSRVYLLINASNMGYKKILVNYLIIGLILTLLITALIYGIEWIILSNAYSLPYMKAPLMSLTFMEGNAMSRTIEGYIIKKYMIRIGLIELCYILAAVGGIMYEINNKRS